VVDGLSPFCGAADLRSEVNYRRVCQVYGAWQGKREKDRKRVDQSLPGRERNVGKRDVSGRSRRIRRRRSTGGMVKTGERQGV